MNKLIVLAESEESFRNILVEVLRELLPPKTNQENSELLTIDEASSLLNISKTTLGEWKKNGIIPFIRLGKRIYFEKSKLIEAGRTHEKYQHKK